MPNKNDVSDLASFSAGIIAVVVAFSALFFWECSTIKKEFGGELRVLNAKIQQIWEIWEK